MKFIHIIDQLSEKNYGISLLIKNIVTYVFKEYQVSSDIICNKCHKNFFFKKKQIFELDTRLFLDNFFFLLKKIKQQDVIHIHGLWNLTYILSILISIYFQKKIIVYLHGTLLDSALNNNGSYLKKKIKLLIIILINFILNKKCFFIAITSNEKKSIKLLLKKSNIIIVPNPVEKNKTKKKINYSKNFVYFGRVNKIKNLILLIKSFLYANVREKFKLNLYLIDDDYKLMEEIKNLTKFTNKVFIKKPVYGTKKNKILQHAWINILLSKSEVMSYSVLEAAMNELPSIVTKNISINNFSKNGGISVNQQFNQIVKIIENVSRWSLKQRKLKGKKVRKFVINNFSQEKSFKKLKKIYES